MPPNSTQKPADRLKFSLDTPARKRRQIPSTKSMAKHFEQEARRLEEDVAEYAIACEAVASVLSNDTEDSRRRLKQSQLAQEFIAVPDGRMDSATRRDLQARLDSLSSVRDSLRADAQQNRRAAQIWSEMVEDWFGGILNVSDGFEKTFDDIPFQILSTVAHKEPRAVSAFILGMRRLTNELVRLIDGRNIDALRALAVFAIQATRTLKRVADMDPEFVSREAQHHIDWPVLQSRKLNLHGDPQPLLVKIKQGKAANVSITRRSKWSRDDTAGAIAWSLLHHLMKQRDSLRREVIERPWRLNLSNLERSVLRLPPLSNKTWPDWWEVAHKVLKQSYPDYNHERLREIGKRSRTDHALSGKALERRIRKAVPDQLREKFQSFAGANTRTRKRRRGAENVNQ